MITAHINARPRNIFHSVAPSSAPTARPLQCRSVRPRLRFPRLASGASVVGAADVVKTEESEAFTTSDGVIESVEDEESQVQYITNLRTRISKLGSGSRAEGRCRLTSWERALQATCDLYRGSPLRASSMYWVCNSLTTSRTSPTRISNGHNRCSAVAASSADHSKGT